MPRPRTARIDTADGSSPPEAGDPPAPGRSRRGGPRATAQTLAGQQREISVSEFFAKNRHLLGFDNPRKALLTTVKEAVDNSLDACEEAGILPDITVVIEELPQGGTPAGTKPSAGGAASPPTRSGAPEGGAKRPVSSRYRVTVVDNGPGIVRRQVENIFGRLLYGSKFHRLKMSRGQQGIGISAAGMYGLITTGRPMMIQTRPSSGARAHHIELAMNTKTNRAEVTTDVETDDFPLARLRDLTPGTRELAVRGEFLAPSAYPTGTSVSIELEGRYQRGRGSVDEFLELTAIANPHARIVFVPPGRESGAEEDEPGLLNGRATRPAAPPGPVPPLPDSGAAPGPTTTPTTTETGGVIVFPRAVAELPPETREIQPHPRGIELGILLQMLKDTKHVTLFNFLQEEFSKVSSTTAGELCRGVGLHTRTKVSDLDHALAERLFRALQDCRLAPPPTDCLAPIGVRQLLAGMLKGVRAEFYAASTREPAVYRGRPFQIEAAIAFGGQLPSDEPARVIRFANRVPLLYQQSACSSFKAVLDTNWRNYDLQQPRGSLPVGPLVILIHMASVWVPFTSESKEAIADYDEIRKEMKLALMECGRKLGTYLRKRLKMKREGQRRDVFARYIGEIAKAVNEITGTDAEKLYQALLEQARARTAVADVELDEDGRVVRRPGPAGQGAPAPEDPGAQEGVIIVPEVASAGAAVGPGDPVPAGAALPPATSQRGPAPAPSAPKARSDPGKPRAQREAAPSAAPPTKPKLRLDARTGRLVPAPEAPGLF